MEQQPKPPSTHEKLKNALAKRDFWRKAAADPAQTPSSAAAATSLAKSWDAAALAYQKALMPPDEDADESNAATAVNLTLPPDLARAFQRPNMKRSPKSETSQSNGAALSPERPGYVYVLSTAYADKAGLPIVKIGRTSRTPDQRNEELSRGGPIGMKLVGAVTTRDAVTLEMKAHRAFSGARFFGDGGTEYFAVNPNDVLTWLRAEAPRVEINSSRNAAWYEYVESRPWKAQSGLTMFGFAGFLISWLLGSLWETVNNNWPMVVAMPFLAGGIFGCISYSLRKVFLPNIEKELSSVRTALEEKYHLPPGLLLTGPAAGYKHGASRRT